MNPNELRKAAKELYAAAEAIIKTAETEKRDLTAEEIKDMTAKREAAEDKIKAAEAIEAVQTGQQRLSQPTQQPVMSGSGEGIVVGNEAREKDGLCGFRDMADFALCVRTASPGGHGSIDQRLIDMRAAPSNYHQEKGSDGFMVPPAMAEGIWELVFADEGLLQRFDPEPTSSNAVDTVVDESTPWGSTGVTTAWRTEAQQMTPSRLSTDPQTLRLNELYAFVTAGDELLADAPRLNDRLTRKAPQAIRFEAEDAVVFGNGVGRPHGFYNSAGKITVAKKTSQTAATIVTDNISKMLSRLMVIDGQSAFWLANRDTLPQLIELTIGNQPVWTPPNQGMKETPGGNLLGYPLYFSEHCNSLGAEGDLMLVNPAGYHAVVKNGGIEYAESIHLYFDYGLKAFRWTFRIGGQSRITAPVTPKNGSNTKSYFITLAVRS